MSSWDALLINLMTGEVDIDDRGVCKKVGMIYEFDDGQFHKITLKVHECYHGHVQ